MKTQSSHSKLILRKCSALFGLCLMVTTALAVAPSASASVTFSPFVSQSDLNTLLGQSNSDWFHLCWC